ncbi:hypothetical protein BDR03DRAFT_814721, partial [Suillus americanus]
SRTHVRLVLKPQARPLHMFRSRKEFVKIICDICAVEMHHILHRDCSLNNVMIEDSEGGSRGALIDWEFASRIASDNIYPADGMLLRYVQGMIPFMSIDLLDQMVRHFYRDDIESLFYVFIWVCIVFKGPAGTRRHLD